MKNKFLRDDKAFTVTFREGEQLNSVALIVQQNYELITR